MASDELTIKPERQVDFYLPILEAYIDKLVVAFSQSKGHDYSKAEWQLILGDGHIGKLLNRHVLIDSWELMSQFLKRDTRLFAFIEEKQSGLMEKDYKFWIFFSPQTANDFFKNQMDRPKNFNTQAILTLPYIKLLDPVISKLDRTLAKSESSVIERMFNTLEILELAEWYLEDADFVVFDAHFKKVVANLVASETATLMKEIKNPVAPQVILNKRLNGLFKIGWRYFRSHNELETRYFKKLLSEDPYEIEKGLKLMQKKVLDYRKSQSSERAD